MSNASVFLRNWVRKNITPTTAHVRDDTLTAGRLAEECLWEAQGENLSAAEVTDAARPRESGDPARSTMRWIASLALAMTSRSHDALHHARANTVSVILSSGGHQCGDA